MVSVSARLVIKTTLVHAVSKAPADLLTNLQSDTYNNLLAAVNARHVDGKGN